METHPLCSLVLLALTTLCFSSISAVDFVFNGFNSTDLLLYGDAKVESRVLSLTNDSSFSIGRVLYSSKIRTRAEKNSSTEILPFSSSFIFSISRLQDHLPGHGFVFILTPNNGIQGTSSAQHLGLFNFTNNGDSRNHVFGVEFDLFSNPEFNDINDNHVGVDLNSLTSSFAEKAGYWPNQDQGSFKDLVLNNGVNYQAWIDYSNSRVSVTMAPAGVERPRKVLINASVDLSDVLLDEMYVGFCGSTGRLVENHRILAWSFSNSDSSVSNDSLIISNLPSFIPRVREVPRSKGFIAGIVIVCMFVIGFGLGASMFLMRRKRRRVREREEMEAWELEYWPHRINYGTIYSATKGFSEENVIGIGGNGKVYKGTMGGTAIAVKRFKQQTEDGLREFLAEVSSLGRLKHRNLVGLRGWCKQDKGSLVLVYDYMENGSLDKRVFECEDGMMLNWEDRVRVLKDVARGVLYLHEGWESTVLHRDIKASNVLLDKDMDGRLGDFGLARMHGHGQVASTTRVVGTVGYMAPEVVRNGRASVQTDVFGFGILILEVVCGRMPVQEGKQPLVDWVLGFMEKGELSRALDERLKDKGGFHNDEVERLLHLGLLCVYPDPSSRPSMRQVVKVLEGGCDNLDDFDEGLELSLRDRTSSMSMWSSVSHRSHPTFDDIRKSLSSSMSLSWSDIIVDGR